MSSGCKPTFLPCDRRPPNQLLSFDQNQWGNGQAFYLPIINELNSTVNSSTPTNCADGFSVRSEEETPTLETSLSDSEDTVTNSQVNVELTWEPPRCEKSPVTSPRDQDFPCVEQDYAYQYPSLPSLPCEASLQTPCAQGVNLSSPRNPTLSKAYNVALQVEPRVQKTLTYLAPLIHSTVLKERVSGKTGTPRTRTRIPNGVKNVITYLHDAYFSVYPDATVKDIAGRIACYLEEWGHVGFSKKVVLTYLYNVRRQHRQ